MSPSRHSTRKTYTEAELAGLFATYFGDKLSQSQLDSLVTVVASAHANRNERRKRSHFFQRWRARFELLARRLGRHPAQWRSRIGLQQRIMAYVILGLVLIFGSVAFVGLQSIQQATALVYQQRLTLAYTISSTLMSDFRQVDGDAREEQFGLASPDAAERTQATNRLLSHFNHVDPFRFFSVTGLWVLSADGDVLAAAGSPMPPMDTINTDMFLAGDFQVVPPFDPTDRNAFGAIVGHLSGNVLVVVHAQAANSTRDFQPAPDALQGVDGYHLEVVGRDGRVALGIGNDERPGDMSYHFPMIQPLMGRREAATILHQPGAGDTFEPHVMAVVPVSGTAFYLVLEQPADVALALPIQLEHWLVVLTLIGFLAALALAWITTRHVVRPTQQLTAAALRMAGGDLESPVRITAEDEVGRLARSLESMRQQLRSAYQQLAGANRVLEAQVRERTAQLSRVLQKIISAQEDERARLARELHDETAQTLGALTIALDRARDELDGAHPQTVEQLAEARVMAASLLEETRRIILDLRPLALDDLGLAPAIRWYAESHLDEQGIKTVVEVDQPTRRLPKHVEVSVFRVVQEAANNIVKHARARHVRIRLICRERLAKVVVADDGQGFDTASAPPARSVGLAGMQERVRLLNGCMRIRSQPGKGTTIAVQIPIVEEGS
jgi:signal transduction histidine kinase